MATVVIDLKDAAQYMQNEVGKAIREGAKKGLYSAAIRMVGIIQSKIIPQTVPEPVARGVYKAGWKYEQIEEGAAYFNTVPYAAMIEHGVRRERVHIGPNMIRALMDWVRLKGIASSPEEAHDKAWAVAKSLQKKGIFKMGQGLKIMTRANDEELTRVLEEEVKREVDRAFGR